MFWYDYDENDKYRDDYDCHDHTDVDDDEDEFNFGFGVDFSDGSIDPMIGIGGRIGINPLDGHFGLRF